MRKIKKILTILLMLTIITPYLIGFTNTPKTNASNIYTQELDKLKRQTPYMDPKLANATGKVRVILVAKEDVDISQIASEMISCRATPPIGGVRLILGTVDANNIEVLASNSAMFAILEDREIGFTESPQSMLSKGNFLKDTKHLQPEANTQSETLSDNTSHDATMREVVKIMNATGVWSDYGVTGEGVTIAIIDTGVDYGSMGLGYWDVVARDWLDYPAAFDADATCLAYTNITLTAFSNASGTFIPTQGLDPLLYIFGSIDTFSAFFGDVFPSDMEVTGILNDGQTCHWGVMFQWLFGLDLFPVLVVDSDTNGVYETVYVDISFDWYWIPYLYYLMGYSWPYWFAPWPPDYSFTDENPINTEESVGARDFSGDGIFDISVSSLGYFLDVYGASPNIDDRGLVLQPIDPDGNYACFVYDFDGHGTACASSAAGRDLGHPLFGYGLAYDAQIMGVTALFMGDIIEGEFWAAGFDLIPGTEGWQEIPGYGYVYGTWSYTGNHKADIISNSWGSSAWALYCWMENAPWYTVLTMLEDALTIPYYLDPSYPGTIIVHAGGNGGSGYGTFTEPGYSTLTIGVGASTSMNWTMDQFGFAGGYYDDVIAWSARGPTALGTVKPDVLGIGAFGYAPTALFQGLGDGRYAFWLFGGTSMATPLVAGAAALVVQAFREANLFSPTNEIVKTILKSTAVDLGYDPFLQGSGRVDCYNAVSLATRTEGVAVFSDATWRNVLEMIQVSAWINYDISNGLIPPYMPPSISDTSWFAGTVKPGENTTAEFVVVNPTATDVNINVSSVTHKQIGTAITLEGITEQLPDDWTAWDWQWGNITILENLIPENAELMTVSLTFPYEYFDYDGDYNWNQRLGLMVQDWNDTNGDGEVNIDEVWQINYGYNVGTSNEVTVGFPQTKFKHTPIIFVYQRNNTGFSFEPIPFKLCIKFYERAAWNWINLTTTSLTVPQEDSASFNATLTVPLGTPQGVYEGQIIATLGDKKIAVPVSVNVPTVIPAGQLVYDVATPEYDTPYNPFTVEGYFDWNWRYEAGDWKNWLFEFTDTSTLAAFVTANWEGNMTDVDMFSIHPVGMIVDGTGNYWTGDGGIFLWNTRTGSTEESVFLYTAPLIEAPPLPKLHTVLLHNVLFDGSISPETLSCNVKMINVSPASPTHLIAQPGESKSITFNLSTGIKLTNVNFFASSPFPMEVEPATIDEIPEMGSITIKATVHMPSHVSLGQYMSAIYIMSAEIPMPIPIYIYIDVPTLKIVDVKTDMGKIHFVNELAQLYITTAINASLVDMNESIQATLIYRATNGTYLSLNLNEVTPISLGIYVVEFEVPTNATSCCLIVKIEKYIEDTNTLYRGLSMASFDVSSTLNGWNTYLQNIVGDVAFIKTDVETIKMNLTSIDAKLSQLIINSKNELVALINTNLGIIQADLDNLNATLISVNGATAEIRTRLGTIETSLETLDTKIEWIESNVTAIRTSLGDNIRGIIERIDDNVATIKTDIGTIKVNTEDIQGYAAKITDTTSQTLLATWAAAILALIAAICSIVTLILTRTKKPT